mgnify:FL=1|jgi:hypothetical protein
MTWRLIRPIWRLADVTANQRLVLLALASFTDRRGANAYPSQGTLARMCCCTTRTIRRTLADLIAIGLIEPHGKARGGTVRYSVNVNVLPTQDSHVRPHRTPVSYNPSNSNPSKINPSKSKRDYFDSDSDSARPPPDEWGRPTETFSEAAVRLARARRQQT